jgi:hypothetical protein
MFLLVVGICLLSASMKITYLIFLIRTNNKKISGSNLKEVLPVFFFYIKGKIDYCHISIAAFGSCNPYSRCIISFPNAYAIYLGSSL